MRRLNIVISDEASEILNNFKKSNNIENLDETVDMIIKKIDKEDKHEKEN